MPSNVYLNVREKNLQKKCNLIINLEEVSEVMQGW